MQIAIQKIFKLKSQITLVQIYNGLMASIIMLIVVLSSIALSRPISQSQFENVSRLSLQATFPETQEMAQNLVLENQISYIDYFRLMQAHQFEQNRAKQLPALAPEVQ